MAEVYAARKRGEAGFERLVAVKRMLPNLADNQEFMTMFLDEGRLAGHITSPNVVATTDLGRADDGSPYIVMDLVVGLTFSQLCRMAGRAGEAIPTAIVVELIAQAAEGLHAAHEATTVSGERLDLVHRDVTPQNILCGIDGRARITDFGVARAMLRYTRTTTGQLKGKFGYFSPEQARGEPVDRRSDLFALGVVAWEGLTGARLFRGETPIESLHKLLNEPVPAVTDVNPAVPDEVADAVAIALARDRDERVPTGVAFASALRGAAEASVGTVSAEEIGRFVERIGAVRLEPLQQKLKLAATAEGRAQLASSWPPPGDARRSAPNVASTDATPTEVTKPSASQSLETHPELRPRRKRRGLVVLAAAMAVGLAAGAWAWLSPNADSASSVRPHAAARPAAPSPRAPEHPDEPARGEGPDGADRAEADESALEAPPTASESSATASAGEAGAVEAQQDEGRGAARRRARLRARRRAARRARAAREPPTPENAKASSSADDGTSEPRRSVAAKASSGGSAASAAAGSGGGEAPSKTPSRPSGERPAEPQRPQRPGLADVDAFDQFVGQ